RQVYDVLDNFRRLPEYSVLRSYDAQAKFSFSGEAYGPGAEIDWTSSDVKVGNGKLTIASATPDFDKIDSTVKEATIVWNLDNSWHGQDKHFTLDMARQGSRGQLTQVTWSYDVAYGWNLVNRFANLYIHGEPDSFIQFTLNNLQNVLASVPNIDYSGLVPYIEQTQATPVLLLPTQIARKDGLEGFDFATDKAIAELEATAKKLGVTVTGPRIIFTTNYGDQNYSFDVALPIDSTSLTINGQSEELTPPTPLTLDSLSAPAPASSTATEEAGLAIDSRDRYGRLVVDGNVRATLALGGPALMGVWNGTFAGVPQTRDMLKAYAKTHGYTYDDVANRPYNIQTKIGDNVETYSQFKIYLPLISAPEQTPEQAAGIKPPSLDVEAPAPDSSVPAPASSSPAVASSAEAPAGE
ncbi:MAG: polyketide cyclase, partial [Rhodanobacter sp.]